MAAFSQSLRAGSIPAAAVHPRKATAARFRPSRRETFQRRRAFCIQRRQPGHIRGIQHLRARPRVHHDTQNVIGQALIQVAVRLIALKEHYQQRDEGGEANHRPIHCHARFAEGAGRQEQHQRAAEEPDAGGRNEQLRQEEQQRGKCADDEQRDADAEQCLGDWRVAGRQGQLPREGEQRKGHEQQQKHRQRYAAQAECQSEYDTSAHHVPIGPADFGFAVHAVLTSLCRLIHLPIVQHNRQKSKPGRRGCTKKGSARRSRFLYIC